MKSKKPIKLPTKGKFTPPTRPTTSAQYRKGIETKRPTFRPQGRGR